MKVLNYNIITKAPIIIPKTSGDINLIESEDFIPGSVILGAIANLYLAQNKIKDALQDQMFKDLFLSDKVLFLNAMLKNNNYEAEFFPLCYQYDKNDPSIIYNIFKEDEEFFEDKQLKSITGLFAKKDDYSLLKLETAKEINFHHARDKKSGTSKKGYIFNYEAISKDQCFSGSILGDNKLLDEIRNLILSSNTLYLGRSKTAQYGKCLINFVKTEEFSFDRNITSPILLTFKSDTILYNKNGFSSPDLCTIQDYLSTILEDKVFIDPQKAFIKVKQIENFISVYKIKRIKENAIMAGSCLELNLNEAQINKLNYYLINGIGNRRNEGFGRLGIDLSVFKKITDINSIPKNLLTNINLSSLNTTTKSLLKKIVIRKILLATKNKALEIVRNNKHSNERRIPNSQLGNIEILVKNSTNFTSFKENLINKCKSPTSDKFKNSYKLDNYYINGNDSYHNFLTTEHISLNKILDSNTEISSIFNSLNFDESVKDSINNQIFKIFFLTILSGLRKLNKSMEVINDNE